MPSSVHACTRSATGCGGPDTTTVAGPFTAATPTPGKPGRRSATASADRSTDAIVPVPRSTDRARERRATVRAASSSDRMPATHAAPISPCEWPITACGDTPACCHTAAIAIPTAHSTG
ncbi:hypothetical protein C5N14_31245 [Micromonospora sp. MW-13]|nr:hypothetical protein C5N14_31245 [Micromonospora sp. MW-13]